jgi:hypothetical protein
LIETMNLQNALAIHFVLYASERMKSIHASLTVEYNQNSLLPKMKIRAVGGNRQLHPPQWCLGLALGAVPGSMIAGGHRLTAQEHWSRAIETNDTLRSASRCPYIEPSLAHRVLFQ